MRYREEESDEYEVEDDQEDDGYVPCPHCGELMLEAADYCPSCDRWISSEDAAKKPRPWWMVVILIILLATFLLTVLPF
ncbi:hypothetical protein [Schlesneria sp. DSM 10557]|uniref:hypothetical protein n=1 Tax=Schlesneria sp. DSM 10557 TaxID=3044399 RepID=UPI0035A0A803